MSKFTVKRSLKQLYIEKHALERQIERKEAEMNLNEVTIKEVNDLRSEKHFLAMIKDDIEVIKERIKRVTPSAD